MDDVHRVDIHDGQPLHHKIELRSDVIELEVILRDRFNRGADLFAANFVPSAVDGVEKTFGEIGARAEKLHLLSDEHRRDATGNRSIITPGAAHQLITLKLDRTRLDGNLGAVTPKVIGEPRSVPDGEIWLWCGAERTQSVQKTEAGLGDERSPIVTHSTDRLGDP